MFHTQTTHPARLLCWPQNWLPTVANQSRQGGTARRNRERKYETNFKFSICYRAPGTNFGSCTTHPTVQGRAGTAREAYRGYWQYVLKAFVGKIRVMLATDTGLLVRESPEPQQHALDVPRCTYVRCRVTLMQHQTSRWLPVLPPSPSAVVPFSAPKTIS